MITTHVLDTARGVPGAGVAVILDVRSGQDWIRMASGTTDARGRLMSLTEGVNLVPGVYRLSFDTGDYERGCGGTAFFPEVQVVFTVREPSEHFHLPLLVSPYGYSTYRGT